MEKSLSMVEILNTGSEIRNGIYDQTETEYESCVQCGRQMNVRKDAHIDFRAYYIEGCGQHCRECYKSVYTAADVSDATRQQEYGRIYKRENAGGGWRELHIFGLIIVFRINKPIILYPTPPW